jgi:REP element-mobilizing transposase RayT
MTWKTRPATIEFWRGRLPHWEVVDGLYFITIHLAGAIPECALQRIRAMANQAASGQRMQQSSLQNKIFREMERWLDRIGTVNYLSHHEIAIAVMEAIEHRSALGVWNAIEYTVMPTHAHLLADMKAGRLKQTIESLKEHTGRKATKILQIQGQRFRQKEWFDHWVRSAEEESAIIEYIRQNPVKAGLVSSYLDWPYGSWRKRK